MRGTQESDATAGPFQVTAVLSAPLTQHFPLRTKSLCGSLSVSPTGLPIFLSLQKDLDESEQAVEGQGMVGSEPSLQLLFLSPT